MATLTRFNLGLLGARILILSGFGSGRWGVPDE